jgi:hypothetical protein
MCKGCEKMSKIRKTTCFKFTALIMAFLFIFQADLLLAAKNTTDYEKQYEIAEKEFHQGQYQSAKVRLLRLINVLNKQEKQEKILLKKVNGLLEKIRKGPQVIEQEGKKKKNGKKRKKFPTLLVVLGVVATGAAVYFLLIKKKKISKKTLTVSVGEGVQGSPTSGTYTYDEGDSIHYNYYARSGYFNLRVQLNGDTVSPSGLITMDRNHTLSASAQQNGKIGVTSSPTGADIWIDNNLRTEVTPAVYEKIAPGQHSVTARKAGYGVQVQNISVNSGQQTDVHFNLQNIKYGTQLFINGAEHLGYAVGYNNPDWFWFYVRDPGTYTIDTYSSGRSNDIRDNYMYLYGPDNMSNEIERDDDGGTSRYARISRNLEQPGNYFVKIRGFSSYYKGYYKIRVYTGSAAMNHDEMKDPLYKKIKPNKNHHLEGK